MPRSSSGAVAAAGVRQIPPVPRAPGGTGKAITSAGPGATNGSTARAAIQRLGLVVPVKIARRRGVDTGETADNDDKPRYSLVDPLENGNHIEFPLGNV